MKKTLLYCTRIGAVVLFLFSFMFSGLAPAEASFRTAAPIVSAIEPNSTPNDLDTTITITGTGFSADAAVSLGAHTLTIVPPVSDTTLQAVVPWGLDAGPYTLKVTTPSGESTTSFTVSAALGQWNSGVLLGGPVVDIVKASASGSTPTALYARSQANGIFYSSDSGEHWALKGNTPNMFDVPGLVVDPLDTNHLYLFNFKSLDGGANWSTLMNNFQWMDTGQGMGNLMRSYVHGGYVIMTASVDQGQNLAETGVGIARSADGGLTWTEKVSGLGDDKNVTALAFDPNNASIIYAGTYTKISDTETAARVYRSRDSGDHWSLWLDGAATGLASIGLMTFNPSGTELWLSTHWELTASAKGVKVVVKDAPGAGDVTQVWGTVVPMGGWDWDQTQSSPTSLVFTGDNTAYTAIRWSGGGYKTVDGGANWTPFSPISSASKLGRVIVWDGNDTFFMGDERYGVQQTVDDGVHWTVKNQGIQAIVPAQIGIDPLNPSVVYSKSEGDGWPGLFKTTDGGVSWNFNAIDKYSSDKSGPVRSVAVDPQSGALYAAADNSANDISVFSSLDGGEHWTDPVPVETDPIYPSSYFYMPWVIKADPQHPGILLIGMIIGDRSLNTSEYIGEVYRSTDSGATWTRMNLRDGGLVVNGASQMDIAFDPNDSNRVYLGFESKLFSSLNNGLTWSKVSAYNGSRAIPLAIESAAPYRLYAGCNYSDDGGLTWRRNPYMDDGMNGLAFLPHSATLYFGDNNGLQVSHDAGFTWQPAKGSLGGANIRSLAVADLTDRSMIYVGTAGNPADAAADLRASSSLLAAGAYRFSESLSMNLLSPLDGTNLEKKPSSIRVSWERKSGAFKYIVELSKDASFSKPRRYSTTKTGYTIPASAVKAMAGSYYWRVFYTLDKKGRLLSKPSEVRTFSVPLAAVKVISPKNSAKIFGTDVSLAWKPVTGFTLDHYEIQFAASNKFKTLELAQTSNETSLTTSGGLSANAWHYWRVRAVSTEGQYSLWSTPRKFKLLVP